MKFTKMEALGNDFLIIAASDLGPEVDLTALARALCDRHYGAGADGMIVASFSGEGADCSSRIFNADGSEAEVSGNGTRCLAAWLDRYGHWPAGDAVMIETVAGIKRVRRVRRQGRIGTYEMEMGVPRLGSAEVPMRLEEPRERVVMFPLDVGGQQFPITATSMGNPHCSILLEDLSTIDFRAVGAAIERHPRFPDRTNVEFVQPLTRDRVRVLFWERGVGETMSSGTGASAATVACVLNGRTDREVTVETEAGELNVQWREKDGVLLLTGPAEAVYEGSWIEE